MIGAQNIQYLVEHQLNVCVYHKVKGTKWISLNRSMGDTSKRQKAILLCNV